MSLSNPNFVEFKFNNKSHYTQPKPKNDETEFPLYLLKNKNKKPIQKVNKICPGCGLMRSNLNLCECNS